MTETGDAERRIVHLDMDAFYAAVEVLDNPELRGKPLIVGGTGNRGVVSTASYEARVYGVHSAQPIVTARKLCPHGIYIAPRHSRYKQISDRIFEIFQRFTPLVEPLSLDEAFLDVTGSRRLFGDAVTIARTIKRLVREEIGLTVSAGVAPTKLAAKIASDLQKPDGLTVVPDGGLKDFLYPLPIGRLWGVGKATRRSLALFGVETIGDLAALPVKMLEERFGAQGLHLALLARGQDPREVHPDLAAKSIGAENTFEQDLVGQDAAERELLRVCIKASRRMRRQNLFCRTVTLKAKYPDFKQITRAETLPAATDEVREIYAAIRRLIPQAGLEHRPVRLLGVSLSRLSSAEDQRQLTLWEAPDAPTRSRALDKALDRITAKYGEQAVVPASLLAKDADND